MFNIEHMLKNAMLVVALQVMGFFVFGGVKGTVFIFMGVAFNTIGGVWYTVIKFIEKQSKEQAPSLERKDSFKRGLS